MDTVISLGSDACRMPGTSAVVPMSNHVQPMRTIYWNRFASFSCATTPLVRKVFGQRDVSLS